MTARFYVHGIQQVLSHNLNFSNSGRIVGRVIHRDILCVARTGVLEKRAPALPGGRQDESVLRSAAHRRGDGGQGAPRPHALPRP